jgi:hypothetical protein
MIRAILDGGLIRAVEPIPADWQDGQELFVDRGCPAPDGADIDQWARELEEGAGAIRAQDAGELEQALAAIRSDAGKR